MAQRKLRTAEKIVIKLWQVEVLVGQGKSVAETVWLIKVMEPSYYRRRPHLHGGLVIGHARDGWHRAVDG